MSNDPVSKPAHYTRLNPEPMDVLESWSKDLGWMLTNVIKYVCRAGHKDDTLKDLRKAAEYLRRKIALVGGEPAAPLDNKECVFYCNDDIQPHGDCRTYTWLLKDQTWQSEACESCRRHYRL